MRFIQSSVRELLLLACLVSTTVVAQERRLPPEADVALALGGGGFLSVTDMAGLTAGLLSVLMKQDPSLQNDDNALANSGLFNRVESISSISGGSWFAAKLAYSKDFRTMIENVAKASQANKNSMKKVAEVYSALDRSLELAESGQDNWLAKSLSAIIAKFASYGIGTFTEATKQSLGFLGTLAAKEKLPLQWSTITKYVLDDIPENTKFGSPVQVSNVVTLYNNILC
jgi:hypothetical protein